MNLDECVHGCLPQSLVDWVHRIPMGRRLVQSAFWSLVSSLIARAITVPIGIILARILGREGYGELGIVYASIELFGVFGGFGLGMTATKYVAQFRSKNPHRAGRIMALSLLTASVAGAGFALLLFCLAPWLASNTLAAPHLAGPLRVSAVLLYLNVIDGTQTGALNGFEAFKVIARLRFVKGLLDFPLLIGGLYAGGFRGLLWGAVLSRLAGWLLNRSAVRTQAQHLGVPLTFRGCLRESPVIWRFSLPALISSALVAPVNWACSAMLVNQPHGYADMGAYNVANQWYNLVVFLPIALGGGLLPILSDRMGDHDVHLSRQVLRFMLKVNAVIVLPSVAIMALLSPYVMQIYGREYHDAWPTLIVVLMTGGSFALMTPVGEVIAASGRMWLGSLMNLGWATVFMLATKLMVQWGSLGLASARLIAYLVHALWVFAFVYCVLGKSAPQLAGLKSE